MRGTSTILVLATAALASAQATLSSPATAPSASLAVTPNTGMSGGTSGCGTAVDAIIDNCLGTTQAQLTACPAADWACMCENVGNVLTCYNNCPSDARRASALAQQTSWCGAAKAANPSSSSSALVSGSATSGAVSASAYASSAASSASAASPSSTEPAMQDSGAGKLAASIVGAVGAFVALVAAY